jgi:hypothetical protein
MIFSVFDQGAGDFAYYEAADGIDINDDRPVPRFEANLRTPIGVPSVEAGRPLPANAKFVGRGTQAIGAVSTGKPQKSKGLLASAAASIDPSLGAFEMADASSVVAPAIPYMAATVGAMLGYRISERQHPIVILMATVAGAYAGFYGSRRLG